MNGSRSKNWYLKWPSRENFLGYKKAKNLQRKLFKQKSEKCFEKATETESWVVKSFGVQSNLSFHQKASLIIMR